MVTIIRKRALRYADIRFRFPKSAVGSMYSISITRKNAVRHVINIISILSVWAFSHTFSGRIIAVRLESSNSGIIGTNCSANSIGVEWVSPLRRRAIKNTHKILAISFSRGRITSQDTLSIGLIISKVVSCTMLNAVS